MRTIVHFSVDAVIISAVAGQLITPYVSNIKLLFKNFTISDKIIIPSILFFGVLVFRQIYNNFYQE